MSKSAAKRVVAVDEGKERRKKVARADLGVWTPDTRAKDPMKLLKAASQGRVPSLLQLKHQRMATSPFTFFRGAAAVMAYDLSLGPHTSIVTQLCGDAHVQNLGAYEGIDGNLIFDINDFDETLHGPFEWDVKRMATSILLAGEQAKLGNSACETAAYAFLEAYCTLMGQFAKMPVLDVARFAVRRLKATEAIAKVLGRAERASPLKLRDKLTEKNARGRVFRSQPPVLRRVTGADRKAVLGSLRRYRASLLPERQHFLDQFTPIDVAFKVVGIGSVGMRAYVIYLEGNGADDPLFLQVKEETHSVYAPYLRGKDAGVEQGQRAADGQRAMQLQSDPMLGWTRFDGRDYLVRQLNDHKATLDATTLDAEGLAEYAGVCGELLARGHARSGEARMIAGYIGGGKAFRGSMLEFATSYAEQTEKDWKAMTKTGSPGVKKTKNKRK